MTVGRAHFAHERIAYKVSFKENWFAIIHVPLILSYWHRFVYPAVPELLRRIWLIRGIVISMVATTFIKKSLVTYWTEAAHRASSCAIVSFVKTVSVIMIKNWLNVICTRKCYLWLRCPFCQWLSIPMQYEKIANRNNKMFLSYDQLKLATGVKRKSRRL